MREVVPHSSERQSVTEGPPFVVPAEQAILSGRPKGAQLLEACMAHLGSGPDHSVTPLDFASVSFMDVSCADELLVKLLKRLGSGELASRFVYVQGLNTSLRETVEAVLELRELAVWYKGEEDGPVLLGQLKTPMREAAEILAARKCLTSAEMSEALDKNVNIVCNRLNALQRMGLVCRLRDGSVEGGGRQYYYVSIV